MGPPIAVVRGRVRVMASIGRPLRIRRGATARATVGTTETRRAMDTAHPRRLP
jgi:hypothetical protein